MSIDLQQHLQDLWHANIKRLRALELKAAQLGIETPTSILLEIDDIRSKISDIELQICRNNDVPVNDIAEYTIKQKTSLQAENQEVQIVFKGDFNKMSPELQDAMIRAIAAIAEISIDQIEVIKMSHGSIIMTLKMPRDAVQRILDAYNSNDDIIRDIDIESISILEDDQQHPGESEGDTKKRVTIQGESHQPKLQTAKNSANTSTDSPTRSPGGVLSRLGTIDKARLIADYQVLHQSNPISRLARHYRDRLLKESNLDQLVNLPPATLRSRIDALVNGMILEEGRVISGRDRAEMITFILDEAVGLGPLETLMRDPSVTEIMVNWVKSHDDDPEGYARVFVERGGVIYHAPEIWFENREHILRIINRILAPLGRQVDESVPMVDVRLNDGSRVNAVISPLAVDGPLLTIRRFRRDPFTIDDLIAQKMLTPEMAEFLKACVISKRNILVSGNTGSGKTMLLDVLASFIPHHERIITIEDAVELRFHRTHPHVARLEARPPNVEGVGEVTIHQLVQNTLRMRPDRIIVGEVRSTEVLDILQAMNTGHEGLMTTMHANSPRDAFSRLETMVMWAREAEGLSLPVIRRQLCLLNIIVQVARLADGSRKVVAISEIGGLDERDHVLLSDIFRFEQRDIASDGTLRGEHLATGYVPKVLDVLRSYGMTLGEEP